MATESHRDHLGENFSEGARLLWLKLPKLARGWGVEPVSAREELTKRLSAARGTVSRYLYGDRRPDLVQAGKLEEIAGIPMRAWNELPKKPFTLAHADESCTHHAVDAASTGTEGH